MSVSERSSTLPPFEEYRRSGDRALRNELVEQHQALVDERTYRYRARGYSPDDLRQVAFVALIGAVERFDPGLGVHFRTFARVTIDGELKRYVRDHTWALRPPRLLQETYLRVIETDRILTQRLRRAPTVTEIADELGIDGDLAVEALAAGRGRHSADVLDVNARSVAHGRSEDGFRVVEIRACLLQLLQDLSPRERRILALAARSESQTAIARKVGVSQPHVSRTLRKLRLRAREALEGATPEPPRG